MFTLHKHVPQHGHVMTRTTPSAHERDALIKDGWQDQAPSELLKAQANAAAKQTRSKSVVVPAPVEPADDAEAVAAQPKTRGPKPKAAAE